MSPCSTSRYFQSPCCDNLRSGGKDGEDRSDVVSRRQGNRVSRPKQARDKAACGCGRRDAECGVMVVV